MSSFGGLILTNRGRNLQAKVAAGAQLVFSSIRVGDGNLSGQSIPTLNALISEKKVLQINKLKQQNNGRAVVGTVLSNQDITTGFYFREIGVFANDPDLGPILYCYGNAGQGAEYISPGGGADIIEKSIDIVTIIGNAQNVSAVIDTSLVFATESELRAIETELEQSIAIHENNKQIHTAFGVNTSANDSYVLSIPGITEYVEGMVVNFRATIANTTNAYLNINNLGSKQIFRGTGTALLTGDIVANKIVTVIYDGTNFQLQNQGNDVVSLTGTQTLSNKTLTAPRMANGGFISDSSGNEQIRFLQVTSAVNEFTVKNATTGNAPELQASGNDANIDINMIPKGTGKVKAAGKDVALQETVDVLGQTVTQNQQTLSEHLADYVKHPAVATTTNSGNNYAVTLNPVPSSYVNGMGLILTVNADSTGNATINVNGLGAIPIRKANGGNVNNLKANGVYTLRYSGSAFILQGEGASGNAIASDLLSGKTASTDAGDIVGTMPNRGTFNLALGANVPAGYYSGGNVPAGKRFKTGTFTNLDSGDSLTFSINVGDFVPRRIIVSYRADNYFQGWKHHWLEVYDIDTPMYRLQDPFQEDVKVNSNSAGFDEQQLSRTRSGRITVSGTTFSVRTETRFWRLTGQWFAVE